MNCGKIDEGWAIDYTPKRNNPAIHKGIDIPKPFGEPILAVADGTVIGIFENVWSAKGIEIMLRHTPEQTGLPFWIYSQYTHFDSMPNFEIGQKGSSAMPHKRNPVLSENLTGILGFFCQIFQKNHTFFCFSRQLICHRFEF